MNIKTNEILLLNKIRFGEGENTNTTVQAPVPEVSNPQNGMNALMFQGLKNLMADPELAQEVGVATEDKAENNSSSKAYVAPYATNMVSFGNKKSLAKAALVGALALGTAGFESCTIKQEMDVSALVEALTTLKAALKEAQEASDEKFERLFNALNLKFDLLISEVQAGNKTIEDAWKELALYLARFENNQQVMISSLEAQGMSIEEANAYLRQLISDVEQGNIDAKEAYDIMIGLITNIDSNVAGIKSLLESLKSTVEAMKANSDLSLQEQKAINAKLDSLYQEVVDGNITAKGFYNQVFQYMVVNTQQQAIIIAQLVKNGKSQEEANKLIQDLIKEVQAGNKSAEEAWAIIQGQLGDILATLKTQVAQLKAVLAKLDVTNSKLTEMNKKIDNLYAEVEKGNMSAEEFYKQVFNYMVINTQQQNIIIAQLVKNGKSQEEANKLIQDLIKEVQAGNKSAEEAWAIIQGQLGDILATLKTQVAQLKAVLAKLDVTNSKLTEMNKKIDELYAEVEKGNKSAEEFYKEVFQYMVINTQQQAIIIAQLVKNGKSQEEANKLIQDLIKEVQAGNKSAEEAWAIIQGQLGDILATLKTQVAQLKAVLAKLDVTNSKLSEMNKKIDELYAEVEKGNKSAEEFYKEVFQYMVINTQQQNIIIAQLVKNGKSQEEANKLIQDLIKEVQAGNKSAEEAWAIIQGQLGDILATLKTQVAQLKAVLAKLDVTNSKLTEMNKKIDNLYAEVEKGNLSAEEFYKQVFNYMVINTQQQAIIIAQLVKNGKTQAEANNLIQTLINKVDQGTITAQEAWSTIEAQLDQVIDSLAEIKAELANLTKTVKSEDAQIKSLLAKLLKEGKITNAQLNEINQRLEGQKGNLARIENLIAQIENNTENNISKEDMAELISWLNIQQEVRQDELLSVAKKGLANQKTIINLMGKIAQLVNTNPSYAAELNKIYQKLVDIQNDNRSAEAAKATQINNIQVELNNIEAKINNIDANLDQLVSQIGTLLRSIETFQGRVDGKLNTIINLLEDANKNLASLNTEAQLTNTYIQQLKSKVVELGDKIDNIKIEQGGSLTEAQLRAILQERDADNYEKYKALLLFLHAEDMDAAKKNLDAIDENNRILLEILAAIKNLPTEIQVKVAALLEEWDPCCTDGCNDKIHEGIIDLIGGNNSRAAKASRKA